ncbi:MAG: hypothetical protein ACJ8BW_35655 [Ktedonobacteraceae bacterium]
MLTGHPFITHQLNNKSILLLSSSVGQYMTPLSRTAIRRPFGQKKFSSLNQWDEKRKSIGKPTPGPSMGWYSWHILCASNSFVLRWFLLTIKNTIPFPHSGTIEDWFQIARSIPTAGPKVKSKNKTRFTFLAA